MNLKFKTIAAIALTVSPIAYARDSTPEHSIEIKFLSQEYSVPEASIEQLAWMAGRWQSEATPTGFSGDVEHVILEPREGQMPGVVRVLNRDGGYMLFELSSFLEIDGTLTYRNRHFAPDLVAWQAADEYVDRRLVAIDDTAAYFDGITFVRRGSQEMGVAFILSAEDGAENKYTVDYTKVPFQQN